MCILRYHLTFRTGYRAVKRGRKRCDLRGEEASETAFEKFKNQSPSPFPESTTITQPFPHTSHVRQYIFIHPGASRKVAESDTLGDTETLTFGGLIIKNYG
jgi:hypothetical protein